ncbi:hypothetical protein BpHYR1_005674, partial [Brachionus plicatilis]
IKLLLPLDNTKKNEIIENQRDKPLSFNHSLNSFHILHNGVFFLQGLELLTKALTYSLIKSIISMGQSLHFKGKKGRRLLTMCLIVIQILGVPFVVSVNFWGKDYKKLESENLRANGSHLNSIVCESSFAIKVSSNKFLI